MEEREHDAPQAQWRQRLHEVIFEADTPAGKTFDVLLLLAIVLSVTAVVLESIAPVRERYGPALRGAEWVFTILFTIEYVMRLISTRHPWRYATSFYGIIDLLAVLPTYLSLFFTGTHALAVIRAFRLLRVFRIFKIARYVTELTALVQAIKATRAKIAVFLLAILAATLIMGTAMYVVEGPENGFTSIPRGVYWAIVTITTVGYGDLSPRTGIGQFIAALAMLLGYSLIIIPTGIFSAELVQAGQYKNVSTQTCQVCAREGHDLDATHCKYCGAHL